MSSSTKNPSKRKAFKDYFDRTAITQLAHQIQIAWADFPVEDFRRLAGREIEKLEFNQRVSQIASALRACLPDDFAEALVILKRSLPDPLPNCDSVTDGWLHWPLGQLIADFGTQHFDASMDAMIALTQRFSAEFAVRPFVQLYPLKTVERLQQLTLHENPHVRRWCSEGLRPRLPWGVRLDAFVLDPSPLFPILDALYDDPELYVRRSVANHLNDIAKDHPDLVVARCRNYLKGNSIHSEWVARQALRTLIKNGNVSALSVLGFRRPRKIAVQLTLAPATVQVGEAIELKAEIQNRSSSAQKLAIDFAITFVRQNARTSRKVFKWKNLTLAAGACQEISKKHPMKMTTVRRLYCGRHRVEVLVNGECLDAGSFQLLTRNQNSQD